MGLCSVTGAIGNGLAAGAAGTAAMTLSSTIEMTLRGREPSSTPAQAAAKVLGVEPSEVQRFATIVHWGYGTVWGAFRGLVGAAGLGGAKAAAMFFATVWGAELATLPVLGIGVPPVWRWGAQEVAIDALHHIVYATATSVTCDLFERRCG